MRARGRAYRSPRNLRRQAPRDRYRPTRPTRPGTCLAWLARRGVRPEQTLIAGDEFGSSRRFSRLGLPVARARGGGRRLLLGRRRARGRARRRRRSPRRFRALPSRSWPTSCAAAAKVSLPERVTEEGWQVVIDGQGGVEETVRETLLTISDGRIGTRGTLLPGTSNGPPVLAGGRYAGRGSEEEILAAPIWNTDRGRRGRACAPCARPAHRDAPSRAHERRRLETRCSSVPLAGPARNGLPARKRSGRDARILLAAGGPRSAWNGNELPRARRRDDRRVGERRARRRRGRTRTERNDRSSASSATAAASSSRWPPSVRRVRRDSSGSTPSTASAGASAGPTRTS